MKIIKRMISITMVIAWAFMAIGPGIPVLAADSRGDAFTAVPIQYSLSVDGKNVSLWAYVIDSDVYFKLRDLAMVLNDTERHFAVTWTDVCGNKQVKLSPQLSYTPMGEELSQRSPVTKAVAHPAAASFYIDTRRIPLRAFTVSDTHYILLADLAANLSFAEACDQERHIAKIDTTRYDTGLYSFLLPEAWKTEGNAEDLNFTRSGHSVGYLDLLTYDPDCTISQFQGNHRETLSSENLSGFAYPAAKALIRATRPAAANDDSFVDELHIYIMLSNLRCAFDFSFDSAQVDEKTAIAIVKSLVPQETALKIYPIACQWAGAIKNRDGRAQYKLMTAGMQSDCHDFYESCGWITGCSSPWVDGYVIEISENRAMVFYESITSVGFAGYAIDELSFSEENGQLRISGLNGVNDLTGYNAQENRMSK